MPVPKELFSFSLMAWAEKLRAIGGVCLGGHDGGKGVTALASR